MRMAKILQSSIRGDFILLMLWPGVTWAQDRTITGRIIDADANDGMPGVNILEKGTSNGAVADADGNYSIRVKENAALVFSFVGYVTQEVVTGTQTIINVTLNSDVQALSEVIVVGYGSIQKKDLT